MHNSSELKNKMYLIARVSDSEQRKALPAQRFNLKEYAEKMGYTFPEPNKRASGCEYYEFDESAYRDDRRKFAELIERLRQEKGKCIVVFDKIDRFTRDASQREVQIASKLVKDDLLELHFPSDNLYINADSPATDQFRLGMGMLLGKYYSDASRDNVKRRFNQMLNEGIWPHMAPIGYKNVQTSSGSGQIKKEIQIDIERSHHVARAFSMRAQGASYSFIAKQLMADGYRGRGLNPRKLNKSAIEKMINGQNSKFYYGVMTHAGREYKHIYPAIITRALYSQCQRVRDSRKTMKDKYDTIPFTLKGIVSCGKCGRRVSSFRSSKWVYLKCANPKCSNPTTAEGLVLGTIEAVLSRIAVPEEWLEKVIDELREKHDNHILYTENALAAVRSEYDTITIRLQRNYEYLLDGRITPDLHDKYAEDMKARQEELNEKLALLTDQDKSFLITSSYLLDLAGKVTVLFESGDEAQRNALLGYVLSNIQLNDKKLTFKVNYPFSAIVEHKEKDPDGSKAQMWCG